jgi:hypothetical protein
MGAWKLGWLRDHSAIQFDIMRKTQMHKDAEAPGGCRSCWGGRQGSEESILDGAAGEKRQSDPSGLVGKVIPSWGSSRFKGPEAEMCLTQFRSFTWLAWQLPERTGSSREQEEMRPRLRISKREPASPHTRGSSKRFFVQEETTRRRP